MCCHVISSIQVCFMVWQCSFVRDTEIYLYLHLQHFRLGFWRTTQHLFFRKWVILVIFCQVKLFLGSTIMFTGWRPREFFSLRSCSNKDPVGGKMLLCNQMFTCLLVIIFLTKCKLMCKFIIILCNIYHKDRETWTLFNISSFGTLFSAFFVITLFTCRLIGPTGARKPQSGILRIKCLV